MPKKTASTTSAVCSENTENPDDKIDIKSLLDSHLEKIEKRISDSETSVKTYFDSKFNLLNSKITELETISLNASAMAKEAISKVNDHENAISFNEEKWNLIEENLSNIESLTNKIKLLADRLEDQTNRSCRKTLILRGVKENPLLEKTWEDTKRVVAEVIKKHCHFEIDPDDNIERAHRGKKISLHNNTKKFERDIHVVFYDLNDARKVLEGFQKYGIKQNDTVFIEQRYGPNTTWRRNKAKFLRKQLKSKKEILSGYIAFPAKLMVKTSKDGKYFLHTDFSDIEVTEGAQS